MDDKQVAGSWRTIPLTLFLVLGFGGLTMLAVAVQVLISTESSRANTLELLRDKARMEVDGIEARLHAVLRPVAAQGRAILAMAPAGALLADPRSDAFFIGTLAATPQVHSISVIIPGADERTREIRRGADGFEVTDRPPSPQDRRLLERANEGRNAFWDDPRVLDGDVMFEHVAVLRDSEDGVRTLFVQRVAAATLSRAISRVTGGEYQPTPFILDADDAVLAHPLLIGGNSEEALAAGRPPAIAETGDGVLASIRDPDEMRVFSLSTATGDTVKGLSFGEHVYLFAFRAVDGYAREPWLVGAHLDGSSTRTQVRRVRYSAYVGVAVLLLVAVVALVVGRTASGPAKRLARAARQVRSGDLDSVARLPPSRLRELHEAAASFNEMVDGLREHRVIRDLFGKFVPERVAAAMLHSPSGLAPQSCEATILFVDLAGFTTLAESVGPARIVDILNAYFSELVTIIEAHDGIVTQFQGDAILAVFNVPRPVPGHPRRATDAAREIIEAVAGKTFAGQQLRCRIGISTGAVIAGNVGAAGRMNYTVHGDAVNLAARLEQLNKEHGTDVLIAESTVASIGETQFRRIGMVDVRGRSTPVTLYTLAEPS